jgi:diguanylate cyclase (GGDEF)-like protein
LAKRIPVTIDTTTQTVLIVDPSANNRALICECLAQLPDIRPISAANNLQALQLFRDQKPSLVLLDINHDDHNSLSLASDMRNWESSSAKDGFASWSPIIFLSSVMDEEVLARGIMAGGDDFLYKPVSEIVLLAKVRSMLRIVTMQNEIHTAHRELKEVSRLDGLTQIANRRAFDEALETEWKRCIRNKTPLSIIIGDIDFFKQFNDIYSHQAGDACLKAVASALNESIFRVEDMVARYGGEEFAAILPGVDANGAYAVAERMRRSARELAIPHEKGVGGLISCSFGVATIQPSNDHTPLQLLRTADAGLYAAKHAGRNQTKLAET